MRVRRRWWWMAALVGVLPGAARAQWTVFDPANLARAVLSYGKLATQVEVTTNQLANQVIALKKLGSPSYRNLSGVWTGLDGAMGSAQGVGYGASGASGTLAATYPGLAVNGQYVPERQVQVSRTLATAQAVLQSAQNQAATYGPGQAQLDGMHAQTTAIQGHEQALELGTTIGVFSAQELMLLRQAAEAQNNLQAVAIAERVNQGAQAEADARASYGAMVSSLGAPRSQISFRQVP
jgi:P-type conjugative transfer protein TrbJ